MANFLQIKADVVYMVRTLAERYGIELEEDRKVREAMEKIKEADKWFFAKSASGTLFCLTSCLLSVSGDV